MRNDTSQQPLRVFAVAMLVLFSVVGLFISGFLTFLKFRSTYSCDISLLSACQIGSFFSCESVLTSPWSTFPRDVPISVYGTSFYFLLVCLGWISLYRARYRVPVRAIIVALAIAGIGVCVPLSIYAAFLGLCSYCLVLYLLNVSILLVADLSCPNGIRHALKKIVVQPESRRRNLTIVLTTCLVFLALTLVQVVVYLRSAQEMDAEEQCVADRGRQPSTRLVTDNDDPEVEIALFIDLSCPACRKEYENWKSYIAEKEGEYRLKIFHFPRDGLCVTGSTFNVSSQLNGSCRAARAVECIDEIGTKRGLGMQMIDRLFPYQDVTDGDPYFTITRLAEAATALGVPADPEDSTNPFVHCVMDGKTLGEPSKESVDVMARIRRHSSFAEEQGLTETPAALITFYKGGVALPDTFLVKGAKHYKNVHKYIRNAREAVLRSYGR